MRVLLTGGAGYVGSACFRHLRRQGVEAFVYDDLSTGNAAAVEPDRLFRGEINDGAALAALLQRLAIDTLMHFAALSILPDSLQQPERYWRVNLDGTRCVLDAMAAAGAQRIVFSSTASVYAARGPACTAPLAEDAPLHPQTPYGASKLAAEWLIRDYMRRRGGSATILRYFNAAGADPDGRHGEARERESHLVPRVIGNALGRVPELQVFGDDWPTPDGTCIRDYVHVLDIAEAHVLAAQRPAAEPVEVFNIGSGSGFSVLQVIDACRRIGGRSVRYRVAPPRAGDPAVLLADTARLRQRLGWTPRYPDLDTIVATAWAWHRDHPQGYDPAAPPEPEAPAG